MKIAVFCVGNRLMLDDGIGPAVYDELIEHYQIPENVDLHDMGCMTMSLIGKVNEYDFIIAVDAVDGTDAEPGTVFRYKPYDIARHGSAMASLHELKLADLFDAAALLGYECDGICYGMQIENMSPAELTEGLTPKVYDRLPFLVESVVAELDRQGATLIRK
ncbi:hydrogenase maturation protease [Anaerotardibacter muris]|uniref:hydrogenase maturation protease n=1 Tax=Anaerotardibacter muris TaxID=2941505 RepID=UPI00203DBEB3|nr:hydrogenase maturation protease [Anaerotardibacter muris]